MDIHNTDPFSMSFDYASGKTGERFQNPLWPMTEFFLGKNFRHSVKKVKEFGSIMVRNAVESRQSKTQDQSMSLGNSKSFEGTSGSLINSLLDSIGDQQTVADAALNYLSAGNTCTILRRSPQVADVQ